MCFAGRSIRDAASPVEAARQFKRSIARTVGLRTDICPNKSRLASMKKRSPPGMLAERLQLAKTWASILSRCR
ncbi:3-keto-L-gulonate-6-phosphate decarboxylase [Escherichia coli]|uniref:3-keto-L-gulonate-6-phosphate decarboxylase n=1 Tax=Escherichia coli TaxID=562 RepID=A0A376U1N1_ECOLX|nr:3-keto-L-gulonate-6-phosphate decarboxylase [Escherichia coli]